MIEINALSHSFAIGKKGNERKIPVLEDITLYVKQGEIAAILGKSGSGKSTLLNILAGFMVPESGAVAVGGQEISSLKESEMADFRLKNFGFIFQSFQLMPGLNAFENVELPLKIKGMKAPERRAAVEKLMMEVGLSEVAAHYPNELSGGQQQRVSIARALITNPPVILADEPTGSLDSETEQEILDLIRSLNRDLGVTFVIITHDDEVAGIAHRQYQLHDGKLVKGVQRHAI